jgi:hypothetical protein
MSFVETLNQGKRPKPNTTFVYMLAQSKAVMSDTWTEKLMSIKGKVGGDGVERVTTVWLCDVLEIPHHERKSSTYRRLAKVMVALGWTAQLMRGVNSRGHAGHIHGYARLL